MTTTKTKAVLDIEVNTQSVKQLEKSIKDSMDPAPIKEMERAFKKMGQAAHHAGQAVEGASGGGAGGAAGGGSGGGGGRPRDDKGRYLSQAALAEKARADQMGLKGRFGGRAGMAGMAVAGAVGVGAGVMAHRAMGVAQTAAGGGEGVLEKGLSGIPIVGGIMAAMVGAARKYGMKAIAHQKAQGSLAGTTGAGALNDATNIETAQLLGIDRSALDQRTAQTATSSGLRGTDLSNFMQTSLMAKESFGINAGALVGAAGTSGGDIDAQSGSKLTFLAIESGMKAGFRDSKLGMYIEQMAGHIEGLRSKGILIDPAATMQLVGILGASQSGSLQGAAGMNAAKSLEDVVRGAADQSGFASAMMYNVARKQAGPDAGAYDTELLMEEDPLGVLLGQEKDGKRDSANSVLGELGAMEGSDGAMAKLLHKMGGGKLSKRQSLDLIQSQRKGWLDSDYDMGSGEGGMKKIFGELSEQGLGKGPKGSTAGMRGGAALEAGMVNKDISIGKGLVGDLNKIRSFERSLGENAGAAGGGIMRTANRYKDAWDQKGDAGGFSGIMKEAGKDMQAMFKGVFDTIKEAMPSAKKVQDTVVGVHDSVAKEIGELKDALGKDIGLLITAIASFFSVFKDFPVPDFISDLLKSP